ncbi:MAG TPA: ComEC/Rec2 family competence protein [Thermaerobacter sp.]
MAVGPAWAIAYGTAIGLWALVRWPLYHAGPPSGSRSPLGPLAEAVGMGVAMVATRAVWLVARGRAGGGRQRWRTSHARPRLATQAAGGGRRTLWAAGSGAALVGLAAATGWLAAETWTLAAWRPAPWEGREVRVTGRLWNDEVLAVTAIEGVPVTTRLRLDWASAGRTGAGPPAHAAGVGSQAGSRDGRPPASVGHPVEVWGQLRRLRPATNPGGYDERATGLRNGFAYELDVTRWRLLASARAARPAAAPEGVGVWARLGMVVDTALTALRGVLLRGLAVTLPPGPRGVAAALLLDERGDLSATAREALAATGLIHALAVSGQHVAMAAALATWLAARARWMPGPRRLAVAGIVVLYAGLTGGPPSVLRAAGTYLLGEAARGAGRAVAPAEMLVWAGFFQAAWRPLVLLDPGFQLSFAATAGLLVLGGPLQRAWRGRRRRWTARRGGWERRPLRLAGWVGDALAVTLAAQVAVLPVQVALFGRLPLLALVANLLVVPLSGVGLAAAAVAAAAGAVLAALPVPPGWEGGVATVAGLLGRPAAASLTAMVRVAMAAGALPAASGDLAPAAAGWLAVAALWVLVQVGDARPGYARRLRPRRLPRTRVLAAAGVAGVAAVACSAFLQRPPAPETWVAWFLDVGQGDAILLRFPTGRSALVDAGGRALVPDAARYWPGAPPSIPDAVGEGTTVPVVRRLLGRGPDLLVLTHADRDHAGGAGAVMERLGTGAVWLGGLPGVPLDRALVDLARQRGVPVHRPRAGWVWHPAPGCRMDVLHPDPAGGQVSGSAPDAGAAAPPSGPTTVDDTGGGKENDWSLVLRVGCGGPRLLLMGDLERAGEEALLARGTDLAAEVLKVSHHGSRGATTAAFLAAVRPRLAVVSVGPNPYGLSHVETLARLRRAGIPVLRTDRTGAVEMRAGPGPRLMVRAMVPGSLEGLDGSAQPR